MIIATMRLTQLKIVSGTTSPIRNHWQSDTKIRQLWKNRARREESEEVSTSCARLLIIAKRSKEQSGNQSTQRGWQKCPVELDQISDP